MNGPPVLPGGVLPLVRTLDRCPDPITLFRELTDGGRRPDTLLLESGDTSTRRGERSFIATRAALRLVCRGRLVTVRALHPNGRSLLPWLAERLDARAEILQADDALEATFPPPPRGSEEARLHAPSPVDVLRALAFGLANGETDVTTAPTVAGAFAYDLLGVHEQLPPWRADPIGFPDFEMWLPDRSIWLDHRRQRATVVAHVFGGVHAEPAYHDALAAIAELARACEAAASEPAEAALRPVSSGGTPPDVDLDDAAFAALVEELKGHIVAGDVFQIVPSRTFSLPCDEPLAAYRVLRALNPSPYMFFVHGARGVLFGASPEIAVRVSGTPPLVEIRPIAGTRRRARLDGGAGSPSSFSSSSSSSASSSSYDHDLDSRLIAELLLDEKELAEHMMLVDLARNDVARVSEPGTRWVDRLLTVERYSHVSHLVSNVRGRLRADLDALHAYVATMNMGTLVGAPKIEAASLLRKHEETRRGPYGGAVGYLSGTGRLDSCIVIRSAFVREGRAHVRAGAGVVYDSDPQAEADETRRKADAVLAAIRAATSSERGPVSDDASGGKEGGS